MSGGQKAGSQPRLQSPQTLTHAKIRNKDLFYCPLYVRLDTLILPTTLMNKPELHKGYIFP